MYLTFECEGSGMAHSISLEIPKAIEVQNSDVVIVVKRDGEKLGTLTISLGTIDWRPKNRKSGKKGETNLTWTQFADLMAEANK
jgi:hypothetical protein